MGKENKGYKSKYIYESCLAYSGLIAIKIGIQRSENWWFLIYLGIIFVCIALFNIASGYQNKKLPKIKNSNYLLKETQKKFKWSVFNKKTKEIFVTGYSSLVVNINNSSENRSYNSIREDIRCFGGERIYESVINTAKWEPEKKHYVR